jgi:hypothetical protein
VALELEQSPHNSNVVLVHSNVQSSLPAPVPSIQICVSLGQQSDHGRLITKGSVVHRAITIFILVIKNIASIKF